MEALSRCRWILQWTRVYILHGFMKEENHSNVSFVNIAVPKRLALKDTWHQFMMERNRLNLKFVKKKKQKDVKRLKASVHEGKKLFQYKLYERKNFAQKCNLNTYCASVHERKKHYKYDICKTNFAQKASLKKIQWFKLLLKKELLHHSKKSSLFYTFDLIVNTDLFILFFLFKRLF